MAVGDFEMGMGGGGEVLGGLSCPAVPGPAAQPCATSAARRHSSGYTCAGTVVLGGVGPGAP